MVNGLLIEANLTIRLIIILVILRLVNEQNVNPM